MWVKKQVFCEQNQHRGREEEEEAFRGCTLPPGEGGTACWRGGGSCPRVAPAKGSLQLGLPRAAIQCVFIASGFPERPEPE